jgi:hypothetical protein
VRSSGDVPDAIRRDLQAFDEGWWREHRKPFEALRQTGIVRVWGMRMDMSSKHRRSEPIRQWLAGLAIVLCTLIGLFGFWHLAPGATFIVACLAIVGLVISFWIAGGPTNRS